MRTAITIRGRTYQVSAGEDDVDVQEVAAYVDARLAETAGRAPRLDPYTSAVLTLLNVASDLRRATLLLGSRLEEVERDLVRAGLVLEAALGGQGADDEPDEPDEDTDEAPHPSAPGAR